MHGINKRNVEENIKLEQKFYYFGDVNYWWIWFVDFDFN